MNRSMVRQLLFISMAMLIVVGVVGCGSKVSGKYVSDGNALTVEFKSGQAVVSDMLGNTETSDYTTTGNTITIKSKQRGDLQFTIMPDGTLNGNGVVLKKSAS